MIVNPVMAFPIKKRFNTELFIDGKQGLNIQNDRTKKLSDLLEEGKLKRGRNWRA